MHSRSLAPLAVTGLLVLASLAMVDTAHAGNSVMHADWEPYGPRPACGPSECSPTFFERLQLCWNRKRVRCKKQPFLHHLYGDCDLKARPVCPPLCHPTWGYYETHWRCFPGCTPGGTTQFAPAPAPAEESMIGAPEQ